MLKHNYSVMLVDDENHARTLIEERINKISDMNVVASLPNGLAAQKYMREHVVDVVISDIKMPLMDGIKLAAFMKHFDSKCPKILISGFEEFEYAKKAIQYGVKDYLMKPLQMKNVIEALERCCEEVSQRRERLLDTYLKENEALEKKLHETFDEGADEKKWLSEVNDMLIDKGKVVCIKPSRMPEKKRQELAAIYKNLLLDALPGNKVVCLWYRLDDSFGYLILPEQEEECRLVKAIPEYLDRILELPVEWTEIAEVASAEELAGLALSYSPNKKNTQIEEACKYMRENLGRDISREEVAERVWLSPSYFSHLFKSVMGTGYNEYLTELRIERAKELLIKNFSVLEIASAVGFQNARYFSRIFRKKTGYTPSGYRRAVLNGELNS